MHDRRDEGNGEKMHNTYWQGEKEKSEYSAPELKSKIGK